MASPTTTANAAIVAPHHVVPLATPALLREAPRQMVRRPPAVRVRPDASLMPWLSALALSAAPARTGSATDRLQRLAEESTRMHVKLADQGLNPTLRKTGAIDVYMRGGPRAADELDAEELQRLEPGLAGITGGSHDAEEWTVESRSFASAMLGDAAAAGAEIVHGVQVRRLLGEDGRVIGSATARGDMHAGQVVLAAGMGAGALAAAVGVRLPLRGGRGYVVDLEAGDHAPRLPIRIKDHRIVITPLVDRVRVCGSIEFGDQGRPVASRRVEARRRVATRVLPSLEGAAVIDRWAGERPCTPDGVPIIGASQRARNLFVATGHGMWGMILAPVTAVIIADQILGVREAETDVWLSPDRFGRGLLRASLRQRSVIGRAIGESS